MSHTPTPWDVHPMDPYVVIGGIDMENNRTTYKEVCHVERDDTEIAAADAAFIVRAVNNLGAAAKALERVRELIAEFERNKGDPYFLIGRIDTAAHFGLAALAAAEEQ